MKVLAKPPKKFSGNFLDQPTARTFNRGEMFDKRWTERDVRERKKLNVRNNFVENEQKCRRMTTTRILEILTLL